MNNFQTKGAVSNIAGQADRQHRAAKEVVNDAQESAVCLPPSLATSASVMGQTTTLLLGLPFDLVRHQYAHAVRAGLIERSMLAWATFERTVSALEKLTLGPWARRV